MPQLHESAFLSVPAELTSPVSLALLSRFASERLPRENGEEQNFGTAKTGKSGGASSAPPQNPVGFRFRYFIVILT